MKNISTVLLCLIFWLQSCNGKTPTIDTFPTPISTLTSTSTPTPPVPLISDTPSSKNILNYPSLIDLPDWMRDPRTVILANLITQTDDEIFSAKISFLNAFTGEWYDIPVPAEARKYFWYDNIHFGFLSNDLQTIYLIDVSSGQVVKQPVPNKSTRLLDVSDSFSALAIKRDPLSSEDFIFDLIRLQKG